jgi:hypothetical protein
MSQKKTSWPEVERFINEGVCFPNLDPNSSYGRLLARQQSALQAAGLVSDAKIMRRKMTEAIMASLVPSCPLFVASRSEDWLEMLAKQADECAVETYLGEGRDGPAGSQPASRRGASSSPSPAGNRAR